MPAGIGSAAVLTAITHGFIRPSLCIYAFISPLEPQNSLAGGACFSLLSESGRTCAAKILTVNRQIAALLMKGSSVVVSPVLC
jgi:hypothetical protein